MDWLLRLFDLFFGTAKQLSVYIPQSGDDLIRLGQQFFRLGRGLMLWFWVSFGGPLQEVLSWLGKYVMIIIDFTVEFLKNIVARMNW
ncbi:MAG: hypothetical protein Q8P76_01710 [bacterium]|nr:hypothetical protein [bacterium]